MLKFCVNKLLFLCKKLLQLRIQIIIIFGVKKEMQIIRNFTQDLYNY